MVGIGVCLHLAEDTILLRHPKVQPDRFRTDPQHRGHLGDAEPERGLGEHPLELEHEAKELAVAAGPRAAGQRDGMGQAVRCRAGQALRPAGHPHGVEVGGEFGQGGPRRIRPGPAGRTPRPGAGRSSGAPARRPS